MELLQEAIVAVRRRRICAFIRGNGLTYTAAGVVLILASLASALVQ